MKKKQIDVTDIEILNILTEHAELNNKELANKIGLSEGPTLVRVQRLWERGIIKSYKRKMADSTIHRMVTGIKTFMAFGYPDVNIKWMKYKLLSTEEEVVALKQTELQFLIDQDLGGYLEKTRDLFVFLATTGMRYSDSQAFDPTWITDKDRLSFKQQMTGTSAYPPLYEVSRRIIMQYDGVPPHISLRSLSEGGLFFFTDPR